MFIESIRYLFVTFMGFQDIDRKVRCRKLFLNTRSEISLWLSDTFDSTPFLKLQCIYLSRILVVCGPTDRQIYLHSLRYNSLVVDLESHFQSWQCVGISLTRFLRTGHFGGYQQAMIVSKAYHHFVK